ncbi:MAG: outer membrane protein assembly factor, partial [Chitinophagaceae bacterium]|nr:outer membrane protein assembly factor [Chitinophagaceae bacterium]
DLDNLLPSDFRGTAAENYLRDFVSTAHPYAPLIVPDLAKAADVVVAKPTLYFVPDDLAFGLYRPLFANKLVMLEEKEPTPDGADSKSTAKLINKLLDDNEHHVEQVPVLKARLLDVLLADWNRHMDQWRFGERDTGQGKLYYPMPRDRDEALSNSNGLIAKILASNYMPWYAGFKNKIHGFKWQAYAAKDFDRMFLNSIEEDDWRKIISEFQSSVTDQVIHDAVLKLPPPIYAIRGPQIEQTLKARRQNLLKEGMDYYHFLAREVNISGTNQRELFKVTQAGNQIQVRVYKRNRTADSLSVMYNRKFDEKSTEEIRFFGLGKDDKFEVDEDVTSKIRLHFIGGKGDDTFNIKGNVKSYLYDFNRDSNFVMNGKKSKVEFTNNLKVNEYSTVYKYDRFFFPTINVGYNVEDGPLAGLGFSRRTYGFRKEPYASDQYLSTLYAFNNRSFQAKYRGDFVQVFGKNGILIKADYVTPVLNNFYGLGNVTHFDLNQSQQFNRVRYNYTALDMLLTKRSAGGDLLMGAGAHFYHYWNNPADNAGKILSRPSLIGLDSASVYQSKTYGGLKGIMQFSNTNNDLFPTRGVQFTSEVNALAGLKNGRPLTSMKADFTLYSSLNEPPRIVTVTRIGFGHIFSKNYEYFQAMNLGQNNFLRGFRKNRFSGRTMAYASLEARIRLLDSKSYILPGAFGIIAFDDVGRVWVKNEESKRWHNSVGGGLYYAAYNTILISGTVGFSREENLLNFSIGTKFNLNF